MSDLKLYLFDDARARAWSPFALTRPVGELLFGALHQRERAARFWGTQCAGHFSGEGLTGFREPGAAPALDEGELPDTGQVVVFASRAVPREWEAPAIEEPATLLMDGSVVGWFFPDGAGSISRDQLLRPGDAKIGNTIELQGRVLADPWELIAENHEQLILDLHHAFPDPTPPTLPADVHLIGDGGVSLGESVVIEPHVVFDTSAGGIRLDDGVTVKAFTRLAGPAYVGADTLLLGGSVSDVSIGPGCKVRGEVTHTVMLGHTNKAHHGFLGHAYLGSWVNLGAGTTNSNLRNDYGTVRVTTPGGRIDTGLLKLGCLIGDHVKTGIGTMLNTGTIMGAGSNVFGGVMPPSLVPPFSWGTGTDLMPYRLDRFLEATERVFARRGVELTDGMRALLSGSWDRSRPDRS
ncbi:MAG: putative sugar nucleotidyl transferase [Gemmatimonadota bacterium]|nr:MAG: putative sugar nucleotidyl transferase [Gemmatimonadota bacterium]